MGGGLMQLVAYGAQDIYLTGNPQITFFKVVYRRHTNFSMEAIEQTFNGSADFDKKIQCTISRNGDLIHRVYLQVTLPSVKARQNDYFRWVNWVGHALIKNVEVEIGGQRIDKHYGDWLHIWNELTQSSGKQAGYENMVGNVDRLYRPVALKKDDVYTASDTSDNSAGITPEVTLYIPLQFWFCRNPGLALPLIALQYHEVKINLELRTADECCGYDTQMPDGVNLSRASLYVDYIYLDTDERRRFAQVSHEYLIEQLQFTGDESVQQTQVKVKLNFNHPCKELIWVVQLDSCVTSGSVKGSKINGRQWFNYTSKEDSTPYVHDSPLNMMDDFDGIIDTIPTEHGNPLWKDMIPNDRDSPDINLSYDQGLNPVSTAKLQLNGHDRFSEREGRYFNLVQPYQHHENVPRVGINVYSFGLKPEEHQPSGTCNMSRIDNATLQLTLQGISAATPAKVRVYATNYNVLRIMSGMGGLAYSN
tara:strand:+ start:7947 stop:9377 length:1431 start_codon:yes stop_codon:yes gene_type:complete